MMDCIVFQRRKWVKAWETIIHNILFSAEFLHTYSDLVDSKKEQSLFPECLEPEGDWQSLRMKANLW